MKEQLERLLEMLERAEGDLENRPLFMVVLDLVLTSGLVTRQMLADELETAPSTVERMRNGTANPHIAVHHSVYRFLKEKAEAKITLLQRFGPLIKTIERAGQDLEDDVLFNESMGQAFKLELFDVLEAARELKISLPTVNRWCMGQSAPHPLGRLSVMHWLMGKVESRLKQ